MTQIQFKAYVGLILFVLVSTPNTQAQAKTRKASSRKPCPDERTYRGRYRNWVFGFSITIPPGLKGYWNSVRCAPDEKYGCVCMNDHGRYIPLSKDASIEAFVGWEMESEWSANDYANDELSSLRQKQGTESVKVLSSKWIRMGSLRGRRFVVQFVEKNKHVVIDHLIALHQGVEYELILRTPAGRYQRDRRTFERVIASWRLTRRV